MTFTDSWYLLYIHVIQNDYFMYVRLRRSTHKGVLCRRGNTFICNCYCTIVLDQLAFPEIYLLIAFGQLNTGTQLKYTYTY